MAEGLWGPLAAVLVAALVTYGWRGLGVLFAGRVDPRSAMFDWVACVAYAMLAGLVARMILQPLGPLQDVPLSVRLAGVGVALAVFLLTRRSLALGLLAGTATLFLLMRQG